MDETTLTIGELAAAGGVNASTVRYYERRGLMPEPDRVSGQRRYGPDAVSRLRTIRAAQQAGLSLATSRRSSQAPTTGRARRPSAISPSESCPM